MNSPLNSYYQPRGEVYLSDQPAFQQLQQTITQAGAKIAAGRSDKDQEKHLDSRIKNREGRVKNQYTINHPLLPKPVEISMPSEKFLAKTKKLKEKKQVVKEANIAYEIRKTYDQENLTDKQFIEKYPNG